MNKLDEAERARAAEKTLRQSALTATQRRIDMRPLRDPRPRAKGFLRLN